MFTGCSQGGKVTFGNTLCTFKRRYNDVNMAGDGPGGGLEDEG